jgi:Subtilase family/PA domain/Fibronectin type-III domain
VRFSRHAPPRRRRLPVVAGIVVAVGILSVGAAGAASGNGQQFTASPLTPDSTFTGAKSDSGQLAQTDPTLLGQTGSQPVAVMIKYDFDATASYQGGLPGLAATSPLKTGKPLSQNQGAVSAYEQYTRNKASEISAAVRRVDPSARIDQTFQTVYGGVSAQIPANSVSELLQVPGVAAVQRDTLNHPLDDNTSFIGATNVWPSLGGKDNAANNVVVGVIDTGVWPENPMFAAKPTEPPPPKPLSAYHCDFGDGTDVAHLGPTFHCNNKLIGAYNFTQTYMALNDSDGQEFCNNTTRQCSARDSEGHGTHTSSTAAGDCVDSAVLYGVQRGPVCGIAPGAHVIMYRVCLVKGCFSSDSVNAVQQAIKDGVNVLNFSISGGAQPYSDPVELAFLDATNAGISVNASAGNSGPGAATSDHGGPWVTTVGATTGPRSFTSTLHLAADGGATFNMPGVTLTNGISTPAPVVLAQSLPGEDALCQSTLAAGTATGKIVMCQRGVNGRVDKGRRVLAGGAVGMILYNAVQQDTESDNHYLPTIHVDGPDTALLAFVNGHTNVVATWAQGQPTPSTPDVMASFSSRGPLGDWIKPDVVAPGIQVLAGMTPQPDQTTADNGPPGNLFQAIAGTSMASPHAAGVSALVKAVHPDWTPEMIKSALMTSSVQDVLKEDGSTPAGVFDDGAGAIRADRAVNPTLVFDETFAHFVAAGSDPLHRIDLNIPSIDATTMSGEITTSRTAMNVSGSRAVMDVQVTQPQGVDITVGKKNNPLRFPKGGTLTFPITISAATVPNGQYTARINLVPEGGGNTVTIPVAFVKTQGTVTLTQTCSPTTIQAKTGVAGCMVTATNLGSTPSNAQLSVTPGDKHSPLQYKNVGLPGSVIGSGDGVQWSGTLTPALAPAVTGLTPATGPNGGYLPIGALGVGPVAGVGDDTITNFNVPTFYYGAEPYTRVGVVSNGYLVLGGGDSSDIVFTPQHFPNAARPNNVLAPLWSDLNPSSTGAGSIRVATLSGGGQTWLVVDWEGVKNFSNATAHSFEVWLRLASGAAGTGPSSEQVTFSYGTGTTAANAGSGDPASGQNWGAENRDGSSGANIATAPANGSEFAVNTTPPTPGGSVSIPFQLTAKKNGEGTWTSVAALTSDTTPGVTEVVQPITVTPAP